MNKETLYAIALSRIKGIGISNALMLYKLVGSATYLFESLPDLRKEYGSSIRPRVFNLLDGGAMAAVKEAEQEAIFCEKHGIEVLDFAHSCYPSRLQMCEYAPLVLYYRGNADSNALHVLSIVGTRHATEYGKDVCQRFVSDLARLFPDSLVVSGLAYGIDISAHRAALNSGLPTVAVLAHGLDRIYPYTHRDTAKAMIGQGGLLTEFPINTNPDRGNFVRRNRIVAGLADAVIVVESGHKGGSIITARLASSYGRQVFAFPGRIFDEYSQGCIDLLRNNIAGVVTDAESLAIEMGWLTEQQRQTALSNPVQAELFPDLTDEEMAVVKVLKNQENLSMNEISQQTEIPLGILVTLLLQMEMKGLVKALPGNRYRFIQR